MVDVVELTKMPIGCDSRSSDVDNQGLYECYDIITDNNVNQWQIKKRRKVWEELLFCILILSAHFFFEKKRRLLGCENQTIF